MEKKKLKIILSFNFKLLFENKTFKKVIVIVIF